MRLADMRTWTRRRLHDEGEDQRFSDGDIDAALNVGAQQVQAKIEDIAPDAFEREYRTNLLVNEKAYQIPRGFLRDKIMFVDWSGTGSWSEVTRVAINRIRSPYHSLDMNDTFYYGISGGVLRFRNLPDRDVEDGIQLWYVPSLEMSEDDDDLETFGLFAPFHMAVILWAVKLLFPEEGESTAELDAEITKIMSRAQTIYGGLNQAPETILVEGIGMEYSR